MPDAPVTDAVEDELRRIAHALVAEAPAAPGLPGDDEVLLAARPGRARRPLRLAVVAAAAAVLVLVVGVLAAVRSDEAGDVNDRVLAADAGLEAAPQRLVFDDGRYELPPGHDEPVRLNLAGLDAHGAPGPLPGGGYVVVGVHPVEDPPPGFNEMTDMTYGLAVVGSDGRVETERDIEPAVLVGTTATEAILARQPHDERGDPTGPGSIVAHDLATGEERVVRDDVAVDPDRTTWARWAIVAGDLVTVEASYRTRPIDDMDMDGVRAIDPDSAECTLRVTDLATGEVDERPLDLDCWGVKGVQASPDGSQAAVAYETGFGAELPEIRLAVVALPGGTVVQDDLLGSNVSCRRGSCPPDLARPIRYRGMAWDDAATVRVAMNDLSAGAGATDLIIERMRVG